MLNVWASTKTQNPNLRIDVFFKEGVSGKSKIITVE